MEAGTSRSLRTNENAVRLCFVWGLALAAVLIGGIGTVARAATVANSGLAPGESVPSWAVGRHIHFLPDAASSASAASPAKIQARKSAGKAGRRCEPGYCPTPPLAFHGSLTGVQHKPTVYLILWGSIWNNYASSTASWLKALYQNMGNSTWQGIMTQYSDYSSHVTMNATLGGVYTDTSVEAPTGVNETKIIEEADKVIASQNWPRTPNSQFVVATPIFTNYQSGFGSNFCAYHGWTGYESYAFVPFPSGPFEKNCLGYAPDGNPTSAMTVSASHEYAETATDPNPGDPAWITSDGYEIADICSTQGVLHGPGEAAVTELWDNSQERCTQADTYPPYRSPEQPHPLAEASGKLDLFWRNGAGALEFTSSTNEGATWATPKSLGGTLAWDPSPVETGSGHLAVFWRDATSGVTNGNLMEVTYNGTSWSAPINLGMGKLGGQPYAVGQSNGTINVFWRGVENQLWSASNVGGWHLESHEGSLASDPSPVQSSPGLLDVFWKGTDGSLWHRWYVPGEKKWYGPQSLGMGPLGGGPRATAQSNGVVDVFWRGANSELWHAWYTAGSWNGPQNLHGSVNWDPAPAATGSNNVEVWYAGTNLDLWHSWYSSWNATWNGPGDLGAFPLGTEPQVASAPNGHSYVFWMDPEIGGVFSDWYDGTWHGPKLISTLH